MTNVPYIEEILSQPEVLLRALPHFDSQALKTLKEKISRQEFDRIIITGMGASLFGGYPAWLLLAGHGLPVHWVDTAEIIHYAGALITPRSLLWVISQSGRSAEILLLLDRIQKARPACLLATVNDLDSLLAQAADLVLPIDAPVERTVSTRTYMNTLAITRLAALALAGEPLAAAVAELEQAGQAIAAYLDGWEKHVAILKETLGLPQHLVLLGRGPSMAAVMTGALILAEAAKLPALPIHAAEYRHGPHEMTRPGLTALVFAGTEITRQQNLRLLQDLLSYQASAFLVSPQPQGQLPRLWMPAASGIGLPLAEIVPIQLLTIACAEQAGLEPGKFFHTGKVVLSE